MRSIRQPTICRMKTTIDKAHGRGLRAHVWTVNEKHEMKALVKAEADAIITNYPDIAVEIVKNA